MIPLKKSFIPRFVLIYSCPKNELGVLKTWLEENLVKGYIRLLYLLVGTPNYFLKNLIDP
jgi:hypothetical protein